MDIDNEVGDEDKEDVEIEEFEAQVDSEAGSEVNEDKEDIDGTDNTDSESDTENDAEKLPEDIYGNNLYLRNVKKNWIFFVLVFKVSKSIWKNQYTKYFFFLFK